MRRGAGEMACAPALRPAPGRGGNAEQFRRHADIVLFSLCRIMKVAQQVNWPLMLPA